MKPGWPIILCLLCVGELWAADMAPRFTNVELLPNGEVRLELSVAAAAGYRIDAADTLEEWKGLLTGISAGSNQHLDSAGPFLSQRFYRAMQLEGANVFTGDHLATVNGDAIFHPLFHASFVMQWNGKTIYNDPDDDSAYLSRYQGLPKADLILVSHRHGDHFSTNRLDVLRGTNTVIVAPPDVYNQSSMIPFRGITISLANGATTNVMGMAIEAIPAYNSNHAIGAGSGYVLTLGGKRIYMSGDTGNIPEMRALQDIDVAFVCMNIPFTMTASEAVTAVRAFQPRVVYPYHYRNQSGTTTNAAFFKQQLGTDLGIEVRLRNWY